MFECHGWAVLSEAVGATGNDPANLERLVASVEARIEDMRRTNLVCGVSRLNGTPTLWIAAAHNHFRAEALDFFRWLAERSEGNHGLLYVRNDEDAEHSNEFRVWVLARGRVEERADPFLSPCIPIVEDPSEPS